MQQNESISSFIPLSAPYMNKELLAAKAFEHHRRRRRHQIK
jgi:hypothetical protein